MNSITIDSTRCRTTLCKLCTDAGTDKSPFNLQGHRHPYTTPYSLFLEPLKHKAIKFGEIGVAFGASIVAWRRFFSQATIIGFDRDQAFLQRIEAMNLPGIRLGTMDAGDEASIQSSLASMTQDGDLFDVLIDDASHDPGHQCTVIRSALPFLKQGGLLIVEDIFREGSETPFEEAIQAVKDQVSFHTFIICDHQLRYSPGWNNDKMLVIVKA